MTDPTLSADDRFPTVSVIVPLLNEANAIERCIRSFDSQDYPATCLDLIVVDGGSSDGSRDVVRDLSIDRSWLRLVDNPDRRASSAFNRGIEASSGDVICLVGAHSIVRPDYVRRSVDALRRSDIGGVGGRLLHSGSNPRSRAIGMAMMSRFGMASPFRFTNERRMVDTIGHPAYWRSAVEDTGAFDETLERNSDYEFNFRMRRQGHDLLFDPEIVTSYHPRSSLPSLATQFFHYGAGKAAVLRQHPGSVKARHLVPPAMVLFLAASPALARFRWGRRLVSTGALAYATGMTLAAATEQPWREGASLPVFLAAFPVMHVSWGIGLLSAVSRNRP